MDPNGIDAVFGRGIRMVMKKLLLALTLTAFAVAASQADEAKPAKNTKESSCCSAKTSTQAKTTTKSKSECSGCCSEKQQVKLMSPKAAAEMGR